MFIVSEPLSDDDFAAYYKLRYKVLREPWNQPEGSEKDDLEDKAIHFFIKFSNKVVAVCRLNIINEDTGQIRYMAIDPEYQGKGLGKIILLKAEEIALNRSITKIELNARENAVEFYKKCGYILIKESHVLWGIIRHFKMAKKLT